MFISCTSTLEISISQSGNTTIKTDYTDSYIRALNKSNIVYDIDTSSQNHVIFRIKDIDSIGNYLPFHNSNFLEVKNYGDSIIIKTNQTQATKSKFTPILFLKLNWDSSFQVVNQKGRPIKKANKKRTIKKSISRKNQRNHKANLKIKLTKVKS